MTRVLFFVVIDLAIHESSEKSVAHGDDARARRYSQKCGSDKAIIITKREAKLFESHHNYDLLRLPPKLIIKFV